MKKIIVIVLILVSIMFSGCQREASKVSYNLSKEADNFNIVRKLTVINNISDDVLFQLTGKMSIEIDSADNQLEIVIEDNDGKYHKHFVAMNELTTYIVEDIGDVDVSQYKYTVNFNPKMWLPINVETID